MSWHVQQYCGNILPMQQSASINSSLFIASDADLDVSVSPLVPVLDLVETDETWDRIDHALAQFQILTKCGATKVPSYIMRVHEFAPCIARSLLSERTRLSGTASDVLNSMAPRLAERFAPFVSVFVPPLLQLCARTNKVSLRRAEKSLHLICRHCHLPYILSYLVHALKEKSSSLRASAAECMVIFLDSCDPSRLHKRVTDVEEAIRILATDAHPQARATCRHLYGVYAGLFPERRASCVFLGLRPDFLAHSLQQRNDILQRFNR